MTETVKQATVHYKKLDEDVYSPVTSITIKTAYNTFTLSIEDIASITFADIEVED